MPAKRTWLAAGLLVSGMAWGLYAWTTGESAIVPRPADDLVVHEWGTFTSFSGSDSVKLEFRPLVENDLPQFVVNRSRQTGALNPFIKSNLNVLQRMETPVTYFYTERPQPVRVRVRFPQGLLTEFYPPVENMAPPFVWLKPELVANSLLDWGQVWLIPENRLQAQISDPAVAERVRSQMVERLLPRSYEQNHYTFARETDSALVYVERTADTAWLGGPLGSYFEKFLFYRGVGNFNLPIRLTALRKGRFELTNTDDEPIRGLYLVTVDGAQISFIAHKAIEPGKSHLLEQTTVTATVDQLGEAVVQTLVSEGLYQKEALAMVNTWKSSWFGEEGTRLFYLLPQAKTDELLPLEIEPRPRETVRVMVGRLEIMTPEDEQRVTKLVETSATARKAVPNTESYALPEAVSQLGRLAEPALVRVRSLTKDEAIRGEAGLLLQQLEQLRRAAQN